MLDRDVLRTLPAIVRDHLREQQVANGYSAELTLMAALRLLALVGDEIYRAGPSQTLAHASTRHHVGRIVEMRREAFEAAALDLDVTL